MLTLNTLLLALPAFFTISFSSPLTAELAFDFDRVTALQIQQESHLPVKSSQGSNSIFPNHHVNESPYTNLQIFSGIYWTGNQIDYNIRDTQCKNIDVDVQYDVQSTYIDRHSLRGCMFYTADDCLGDDPEYLPASMYPRVPDQAATAASFRCYPVQGRSSRAESEHPSSQDVRHSAIDSSVLHAEARPNGQPNGTVILYTYPHFKGQWTKFRVFSKHCYLPPRKLRNSVKSLIISDKIDSCTFWSEPGCKGNPYWLGAGKIEDLKSEGSGFVSFECLLVGDEDEEEELADGEGEGKLRKRSEKEYAVEW